MPKNSRRAAAAARAMDMGKSPFAVRTHRTTFLYDESSPKREAVTKRRINRADKPVPLSFMASDLRQLR